MSKKSPSPLPLRVSAPPREPDNQDAQPGLVPKLRFPEFQDSDVWALRILGRFLTERSEYPNHLVPLYSLTIEDGVTPKTERYERAFLVKDTTDAYKLMHSNDFAFNPMNLRFGAIGRHSGMETVAVSKYYNIFFSDPSADAKFCELYFRSDGMIAFYDKMAIGSLIEKRRVHFGDFLKFEIPFPSLPEQQKIADCLSSLDELIGAQCRKLDALRTYKKGLMQQLFPREGETQPRLRFPELNSSPEWEFQPIGNLFETSTGGTPSRAEGTYWNGDIPWITTSLVDFREITESQEFITREGLENSSAKLFPKGTVLIALYGQGKTRGQVALLSIQATTNQACAAILPREGIDPYFLFSNLAGRYEEIRSMSNSGGQENLSQSLVREIPFAFPPDPKEQAKITSTLRSLDDLITAESQKLEALKTHKRGLMQQLFPSPEDS